MPAAYDIVSNVQKRVKAQTTKQSIRSHLATISVRKRS